MSEDTAIPTYDPDTHSAVFGSKDNNVLRKRNPSYKAAAAMDGVDERSADTEIDTRGARQEYTASSYTQNSRGGFHGVDDPSESVLLMTPFARRTPEKLYVGGPAPPSTPVPGTNQSELSAAASLPSRKGTSSCLPGEFNPFTRRYVSAMPTLPSLSRVTPFSRVECSSLEEKLDAEHDTTVLGKEDEMGLKMPSPSIFDERFGLSTSRIDISNNAASTFGSILESVGEKHAVCDESSNRLAIGSRDQRGPHVFDVDDFESLYSNYFVSDELDVIHENRAQLDQSLKINHSDTLGDANIKEPSRSGVKDAPNVSKVMQSSDAFTAPYEGFPLELLNKNRENQVPDFASMTLPRAMVVGGFDGCDDPRDYGMPPIRDVSFHDDRALLPSQRRTLRSSADMAFGDTRRTSFWL